MIEKDKIKTLIKTQDIKTLIVRDFLTCKMHMENELMKEKCSQPENVVRECFLIAENENIK